MYKVVHISFPEYRLIFEQRIERKRWCILAPMYVSVKNPIVILVRTFNIGLYDIYTYKYKQKKTHTHKGREGKAWWTSV